MNKGFTLIELLIVIGIIVVLTGMSVAAFSNFRDRRRVYETAKLVVEELRRVRAKAMAVEIPAGCIGIQNYTIDMSGSLATTDVNCASGSRTNYLQTSLFDASFLGSFVVVFDIYGKNSGNINVSVCGGGYKFDVGVSDVGVISQPVEDVGGC